MKCKHCNIIIEDITYGQFHSHPALCSICQMMERHRTSAPCEVCADGCGLTPVQELDITQQKLRTVRDRLEMSQRKVDVLERTLDDAQAKIAELEGKLLDQKRQSDVFRPRKKCHKCGLNNTEGGVTCVQCMLA